MLRPTGATTREVGPGSCRIQFRSPLHRSHRLVGIVVIVVGMFLVVLGINPWNTIADHVGSSFGGEMMRATTWFIMVGIVATVLGVLVVSSRLGRRLR
jgi:uncharacterized membrane protein YidH (DUF202 family)